MVFFRKKKTFLLIKSFFSFFLLRRWARLHQLFSVCFSSDEQFWTVKSQHVGEIFDACRISVTRVSAPKSLKVVVNKKHFVR
jgi:hypothetical protein